MKFSLFRFQITVEFTFLLIVLIFLQQDLNAKRYDLFCLKAVVFFLSFLLHELGHAFMLRKYKVESRMLFYGFGGLCIPLSNRNLSYKEDILVSLAGPTVNILIGGAVYFFLKSGMSISPLSSNVLNFALFINLVWGVFNLIPLLPMDGSSALKNFMLWIKVPRAHQISFGISFALLCLFTVLAIKSESLWNIFLVAFFAWENFRLWKNYKENLELKEIKNLTNKWPVSLDNSLLEKLINISVNTKSDLARKNAAYSSAIIFSILGNFSRALNAYKQSGRNYPLIGDFLESAIQNDNLEELCNDNLTQSSDDSEILYFLRILLHNVGPQATLNSLEKQFSDLDKFGPVWSCISADMHYKKDFKFAANISKKLHKYKASAHAAYNAACSLCLLGEEVEAIKLLNEAFMLDSTFKDTFKDDKDLDSIRNKIEI